MQRHSRKVALRGRQTLVAPEALFPAVVCVNTRRGTQGLEEQCLSIVGALLGHLFEEREVLGWELLKIVGMLFLHWVIMAAVARSEP